MAEYIDREKMLKYLEENNTADEWIIGQYNADWIYSFIESQPTADVEEVKHGEWKIKVFQLTNCKKISCSECGYNEHKGPAWDSSYGFYPYCPNCGAKMEGERNNV